MEYALVIDQRERRETIDEAIDMAKEAISLYIESLEADGEPIPDDSKCLEYTLTLAF